MNAHSNSLNKHEKNTKITLSDAPTYTRRQINLYRMFFADFSVNF